jgi:hypothetical protein
MAERRLYPRRYLMFYSRVFDQKTGELLGHIIDITPAGAMLISEKPLEIGKVFHLQMELPDELSNRQFLVFEAKSVRGSQDVIPEFYDTGLQLIDIAPADVALIEKLVESFGFRER